MTTEAVDILVESRRFPFGIFTVMRGASYHDLVDQTAHTEIGGMKIRFLNCWGLIRLKQDSVREKDQIYVAALRRIAGERL